MSIPQPNISLRTEQLACGDRGTLVEHEAEQRPARGRRMAFFPFYVDDYLAGTRGLTYEEKGFYIELLCIMWARKGGLSSSIDGLAKHLGTDKRKVARLIAALVDHGKLEIEGEEIVNQRLMRMLGASRRRPKWGQSRPGIVVTSKRSWPEVERNSEQNCDGLPSKSDTYDTCDDPPISISTSNTKEETPLSPVAEPQKDNSRRVEFRDGKLTLFNSLKAHWLKELDGDEKRLELGLIQAANYIEPSSRKPLEAQVSAQLARQVAAKRDQDKRYAAAACNNAARSKHRSDAKRLLDAI